MRILIILFIVFHSTIAMGQKWDLRKCVDYALANNISIKQLEIQTRIAELQVKQSRLSQYPPVSFNGNTSFNSGRNQDPTSFGLITESYISSGMQLQTSAEIFNWYSKKNTIAASKWEAAAAKASVDKLKDDIALTVANAYLQILLANEQQNIAELQLKQSQVQLGYTRKLVNAGSLPELNASTLEAQVASDSAAYIGAKGNVEQSKLVLKAYMNIDAAVVMDIDTPPAELIPLEKISDLQPEAVFALALLNLPQQRVNDFKLKAGIKNSEVAKAAMYPSISAFGSFGTGFNSQAQQVTGIRVDTTSFGTVKINGLNYNVYPANPFFNYDYGKTGFAKQLDNNFRQAIGLSVSVPIFNGGIFRTTWEKAKLNIRNLELQKEADNQKLKQDIYQAYNSAVVAMEKFNASQKSIEAFQRTYDFAQKRYNVGMLGTFDLLTTQNNLFMARLENVLNHFDYVFKMKVLEFYKGQGLKL